MNDKDSENMEKGLEAEEELEKAEEDRKAKNMAIHLERERRQGERIMAVAEHYMLTSLPLKGLPLLRITEKQTQKCFELLKEARSALTEELEQLSKDEGKRHRAHTHLCKKIDKFVETIEKPRRKPLEAFEKFQQPTSVG